MVERMNGHDRASKVAGTLKASRRVVLTTALMAPLVLTVPDASAKAATNFPTYRILAFGDSNTWGWRPTSEGFPTERYGPDIRWPRVLQAQLGVGFEVVENGLNLRTTDLDDPIGSGDPSAQVRGADFNGLKTLPSVLAAHAPLDLVIIALGQNDLQSPFNRTASQIAEGARRLADMVADSAGEVGTVYPAPSVMIVSPPTTRSQAPPHPRPTARRGAGRGRCS